MIGSLSHLECTPLTPWHDVWYISGCALEIGRYINK